MLTRSGENSVEPVLGWSARWAWLAPLALAVMLLAVIGGLVTLMHVRTRADQQAQLDRGIHTARQSITGRLRANRRYLETLAHALQHEELTGDAVHDRLAPWLTEHPGLIRVRFVAPGGDVRWISPRDGAPGFAERDMTSPELTEALAEARRTGRAVYTPSFVSVEGEQVFEVAAPVGEGEAHRGFLVGTYTWDRLLRASLLREIILNHQVSVVGESGDTLVMLPGFSEGDDHLRAAVELVPPGHGTRLRLVRYGAGLWSWSLMLLVGLCAALVGGMAWGVWSLQRQIVKRARAQQALREARDKLEQRVAERTADLQEANELLRREISERRRAQQRTRDVQEQLTHVARVSTMGEMAAGLAHELNQPLGAISSYTDGCIRMLEAGTATDHVIRHAMQEVGDQARRAGRIIHRLREFIADRDGEKEDVELSQIVAEVIEVLEAHLRQNQVVLGMDLDHAPPVHIDRIQIQQVLVNLIRNAIDAMVPENNDPPRRVLLSAKVVEGDRVEVAVGDIGPGCDDETLARMFDPFYTTKATGMGMGLAISRTIVEAHRGRMTAEANDTRGITVRFTLPLSEQDQDGPSHPAPEDPPAAAHGVRRGR